MAREHRLISGFFTVGFWTLASRVLGFVRDVIFAAVLGAGPVAEAFLVAFSIPNMFRRIFAEGAFNTAFVPMFSKRLEANRDAAGFANEAFSVLGGFLVLFFLAAQVAMPLLVLAMASGFASDGRFDDAVLYGRIAFAYLIFISLAALLSGVLNSTGRFAVAAAAPVLLNVCFILVLLAAHYLGWDAGSSLAWSAPVAGVAQLGLVWRASARAGFPVRIRVPRLSDDMKRLVRIAAPAAMAGGVVQINLLIGRQVASFHEGAVAWLNYADRLYQLPLGVVGIAIGVVLLPDLSRKLSAGDDSGGRSALNRAAELCIGLAVPASIALAVIPMPLVSVLFERGQFGPADTAATAAALIIYGAGLPAFVLQKVLLPLYFAREDTRTPFRIAAFSMLVNAAVAVGLMQYLGYLSAALGATASGWVMLVMLWIGTRKMGAAASPDSRFWSLLPRMLLAAAVMGVSVWGLSELAGEAFREPGLRYLALAGLVLSGLLTYGLMLLLLGAARVEELRTILGHWRSRGEDN